MTAIGQPDSERSLKSLARMQIGFATVGLLVTAGMQSIAPRAFSALTYSISGAFLGLVLYAGRDLSKGKPRGLVLSFICQLLQVIHLNVTRLGILFLAGPFIEVGITPNAALLSGGVGAVGFIGAGGSMTFLPGSQLALHVGWLFDPAQPTGHVVVGINFVALVFAYRLFHIWKTGRVASPALPSSR